MKCCNNLNIIWQMQKSIWSTNHPAQKTKNMQGTIWGKFPPNWQHHSMCLNKLRTNRFCCFQFTTFRAVSYSPLFHVSHLKKAMGWRHSYLWPTDLHPLDCWLVEVDPLADMASWYTRFWCVEGKTRLNQMIYAGEQFRYFMSPWWQGWSSRGKYC
jgi:hypothetical protein